MTFKNWLSTSALTLTAATLMTACQPADTTSTPTPAVQQPTEAILGSFGVALENMDTSVKPGDNFFNYVNGTWLKTTEIPADKSNYGSFNILADQSEARVRKIIESAAAAKAKKDTAEQKIGDLYAAFMDEGAINAAGLTPLQGDIDGIRALNSHDAISAALGDPAKNLTGPVGFFVYIDGKQPDTYITQMGQSGLGMDRDYYLEEDDKSKDLREKYLAYITTLLTKAGVENPADSAAKVMAYETKLANVHWNRVKRRDRNLAYNKMSMTEFKTYAPGMDWEALLSEAGLGGIDSLILRQDDAIQKGAAIFADTSIDVLQDYMIFHMINDYTSYLPDDISKASFDFYGTAVRGTKEQRARWKRGVSTTSRFLGESIGEVYVAKHFPESSKEQMQDLVENLRATFKDGIDNLEWMGAETKVQAQDKLAKFNPKIGYPDVWKDYSDLQVDRDNLIETVRSARVWSYKDNISKLGKPINRDEWGMTPQTVNAYYNSALNEIVFPAAILDAPFFDPNADAAVNYGGIGAVIGHEMGHGFDDQGRKTDGNGELRDWWTEADAAAFKTRADELVAQFDAFEPLPGLNVNGSLTLGENIGDLTGLTMAYYAYKRSLNGKPAPVIDGLTGDQRFFLAYGQIWQRKFTEDALRNRVKTDSHSPGEYRANGIVRNFQPWYDAFNVQPGDALYLPPEKRVKIW